MSLPQGNADNAVLAMDQSRSNTPTATAIVQMNKPSDQSLLTTAGGTTVGYKTEEIKFMTKYYIYINKISRAMNAFYCDLCGVDVENSARGIVDHTLGAEHMSKFDPAGYLIAQGGGFHFLPTLPYVCYCSFCYVSFDELSSINHIQTYQHAFQISSYIISAVFLRKYDDLIPPRCSTSNNEGTPNSTSVDESSERETVLTVIGAKYFEVGSIAVMGPLLYCNICKFLLPKGLKCIVEHVNAQKHTELCTEEAYYAAQSVSRSTSERFFCALCVSHFSSDRFAHTHSERHQLNLVEIFKSNTTFDSTYTAVDIKNDDIVTDEPHIEAATEFVEEFMSVNEIFEFQTHYHCSICNKTFFKNIQNVVNHINDRAHSYMFALGNPDYHKYLSVHKVVPTEDRFTCHFCNEDVSDITNAIEHIANSATHVKRVVESFSAVFDPEDPASENDSSEDQPPIGECENHTEISVPSPSAKDNATGFSNYAFHILEELLIHSSLYVLVYDTSNYVCSNCQRLFSRDLLIEHHLYEFRFIYLLLAIFFLYQILLL